jgi:hypothetical protein
MIIGRMLDTLSLIRREEVKTLSEVVDILQKALTSVRNRSRGELHITLVEADVALKVVEKHKKGAGVKFEYFVPIEMSANREKAVTHKLALKLAANPEYADLGVEAETKDLADSIINLAAEANKVRQSIGKEFSLTTFSMSVEIGVNREGKLQAIAGGSKIGEQGHTIKLTFRPR